MMTAACALAAVAVLAQKPAIPRDAKMEAKIEKTLKKMTLDEKIGQMLELNLDIMGKKDANGVWQLNEVMLDTLISKWKVGSILNAPATKATTTEQWRYWIGLIQQKSMKYMGIPDSGFAPWPVRAGSPGQRPADRKLFRSIHSRASPPEARYPPAFPASAPGWPSG